MSTTLAVLEQECARACRWYFPSLTVSANSSNTYTLLIDAAAAQLDEVDADTLMQYAWLRCESDSAGTPQNVGDVRRITSYTPSTSTLEVASDRGFTNNPTTTMTFAAYLRVPPAQWGFQPGWKEYINRVLRSIRHRRWGLLTLVTDGDMETSGVTNWTTSNATATKTTTAANVAFGAQALSVTTSATNGFVRSAAIAVEPHESYVVRVDVQVAAGSWSLIAYDATGSATIASESTSSTDQRELAFEFNTPADCRSLQLRLQGATSGTTAYFDNLSLWPADAQRMSLPSWVDRAEAVEGIVAVRPLSASGEAGLLASQVTRELPHWRVVEDPLGATPYRVEYRFRPTLDELFFVRGLAAYSELSATTDTTTASQDLAVAGAGLLAAIDLAAANPGDALAKGLAERFAADWRARAGGLPMARRLLRGVF